MVVDVVELVDLVEEVVALLVVEVLLIVDDDEGFGAKLARIDPYEAFWAAEAVNPYRAALSCCMIDDVGSEGVAGGVVLKAQPNTSKEGSTSPGVPLMLRQSTLSVIIFCLGYIEALTYVHVVQFWQRKVHFQY